MSAVIDTALLVTVLFLAIGGDTEDAMQADVWRQVGLCDKYCHRIDETPECKRQQARFLPCEVDRAGALFWDDYLNEPERLWHPSSEPFSAKLLFSPEWVPSDQPTEHRGIDGVWMKLRLQAAEDELPPPHRVRPKAAATPLATAWGPERILTAIEEGVRAFAAMLKPRPWEALQRRSGGAPSDYSRPGLLRMAEIKVGNCRNSW